MEKKCFKCGQIKPLADFYKHSKMADGHVNKCKDCNKKDVRDNRLSKVDYYREYDRERGNRQDAGYVAEYRRKFPKKAKAHAAVSYAVRNGKMKKLNCEVCGSCDSVAHHDDYDYPLSVRWLCQAHHIEWHTKNGSGLNCD